MAAGIEPIYHDRKIKPKNKPSLLIDAHHVDDQLTLKVSSVEGTNFNIRPFVWRSAQMHAKTEHQTQAGMPSGSGVS